MAPRSGERGGGCRIRLVDLRPVLAATVVMALVGMMDRAGAAPAGFDQELQAKLHYCQTCHGPSGRGFRGFYPIPRLAGQQVQYIENQLHAFIEHRRTNNIMFNVAHVLSPEMLTALAKSFHDFNPPPLGGAARDATGAGREIFENGVAGADVPACAMCHGADAKGNEQFPRLAGQLNDYMFDKLKNWSRERGQDPKNPDTSAIMEPIAHGLTDAQIKAVAAYVSNLP